MLALEFRLMDPKVGLPPVDRELLLELGSAAAALGLGDIRSN